VPSVPVGLEPPAALVVPAALVEVPAPAPAPAPAAVEAEFTLVGAPLFLGIRDDRTDVGRREPGSVGK
jgi:hypothetical protein